MLSHIRCAKSAPRQFHSIRSFNNSNNQLFCRCVFHITPAFSFLSCLFQPLNPNPDSRWNTYFKDNEILLQIDKDVR